MNLKLFPIPKWLKKLPSLSKRELVVGGLALLMGLVFILPVAAKFETNEINTQLGGSDDFLYLPTIFHPFPTPTATPTSLPTLTPTQPPTPTSLPPSATPVPTATPNCHPSYPSVCMPPPPPDLDCGDIPHRNFTVLPPDPHHFDSDGDGIGCEQ